MEFLEEERDAWRPFESLADLPDDALERETAADGPGHGWSGRDLVAHLVAWQEVTLDAARELAVGEASPTMARVRAEFGADNAAYNEEIRTRWQALPLAEVRRRLREVPGELRGYLTVVPETRWVKHPDHMRFIVENTLEHYEEHEGDLGAVLAEAGSTA